MAGSDFEISFYEAILKDRPDYVDALMALAEAYTKKGLHEKGLEVDLRLATICKSDPGVFYNLACSLSLMGRIGEAFATLKRAVKFGYSDFGHLDGDPDLKNLRDDPRFKKWICKIKEVA